MKIRKSQDLYRAGSPARARADRTATSPARFMRSPNPIAGHGDGLGRSDSGGPFEEIGIADKWPEMRATAKVGNEADVDLRQPLEAARTPSSCSPSSQKLRERFVRLDRSARR
jgi:hypothetical protein